MHSAPYFLKLLNLLALVYMQTFFWKTTHLSLLNSWYLGQVDCCDTQHPVSRLMFDIPLKYTQASH